MATAPLFPAQIETLLQSITINMLGITGPNPDYNVRIGWQQQGQPFQQITEDVIYLRAVEVDDQYNRVRDVTYEQTDISYNKITQYTRVWEIYWTVYGPNSFNNGRLLRTRLFDQDIHDQFSSAQLYLVTDPVAPTRNPEYEDGQWWERVDFSARFNEFVTETLAENFVLSANVLVYDQFGNLLFDPEVGTPGGYGLGHYGLGPYSIGDYNG